MFKRFIARGAAAVGVLSATAGAAAVLPGLAQAGKPVYGGSQKLSVSERLSPDSTETPGSTLTVHVDYESTVPGERIKAVTKEIRLDLPEDARINPKNAGVCDAVKFINSKGDPKVCPASSVVGSGSVTADARPTLPNPVSGTLTLYNAKGKHNDIIFYVHTEFGSLYYIFNILTNDEDSDNDVPTRLDAQFSYSSSPGLFTLKTIDFKLHNSSTGKPYIINPPKCHGKYWLDGLLISNYSGQPNLYAQDLTPCVQAPPVTGIFYGPRRG